MKEDPERVLRRRESTRRAMRKKRKDPEYRARQAASRVTSVYRCTPEIKSRHRLQKAVKSGRVIPPDECERCGHDFSEYRREAHHSDYTKHLEVEWLCARCHGRKHRKDDGGVVAA